MGKFIINQRTTGFNFYLKAGNGETIGTSEIYDAEAGCLNGIDSVKTNAPEAKIEDQTLGEEEKNPKFELYKDHAGEFRFRLNAVNGKTIFASEGYSAKESCIKGIESVKKNAPEAATEKSY
jgi:uncharacterized protein